VNLASIPQIIVLKQPGSQDTLAIDERKADIPFRLKDDRVVSTHSTEGLDLRLSDIACIRLYITGRARLCLTLEAIDGSRFVLRWIADGPGSSDFFSFSAELLARVVRRNQFVTFSIGPSRETWIGALLGFIMLIGVPTGITWAALSGRGIPSAALPMALAPFALFAVVPILLNGPSRTVGLQQFINALVEHQPAADPAPSIRADKSKD
jgi:hypothetical protein